MHRTEYMVNQEEDRADCQVKDGAVHQAKGRAVLQGEYCADCHVKGGAVHQAQDGAVFQGEDEADSHVEDGAVHQLRIEQFIRERMEQAAT